LHLFEPDSDASRGSDFGFERYTRLEQQERAYCAARRELLDRLPSVRPHCSIALFVALDTHLVDVVTRLQRLEPLAQQLAQIPGAPEFIVEGHGPQRPLHQPSDRVAVQ
jgi:hypothetical protein